MKRFCWIGILVLLAMAACARPDNDPVETRRATSRIEQVPEPAVAERSRSIEGPSPELSAIDSLMWHQPDSALMCLLPYFDTCRDVACNVYPENHNGNSEDVARYVSTNVAFNRHYANLLLAELLYKNDYAQTNRPALRQAVSYFDSLTLTLNDTPAPKRLIAGSSFREGGTLSLTRNDNLAFLTARAHYINGVGYYESDSVVEACKEYLKALELMEIHFEQNELVGKKARFMTYTYNRLGDLFEEQYMMEPAIDCYKHSCDYSIISPISSYSVSIILYRIGKHYNMKGDKDSADYYYSQALANMPDSANLNYRDIVSTKALLSYQLTHQAEASLKRLKQMAILAADDDERLTRYVVIGDIFFEENNYDSALLYLEPVLENKRNRFLQIRVANYLRIIYDSLGNKEKSNECMHYLALHNETGAENSALASQLSELYKMYLTQKQEKKAEKKREAAVKKAIEIVVPIAVALALTIIVAAKVRSKKLLKKQQEDADRILGETEQQHKEELRQRQTEAERMLEDKEKQHQQEMESERQTHKLQQAALSGRLKRSNEELRDVSKQLEQSLSRNALSEPNTSNDYTAFINAPICLYIIELVHKQQFKSKMDYLIYKDDALSKEQILNLRNAAEEHLSRFVSRIRNQYPKLTDNDMDYCYLVLLGLNEADISALMQRAYTTVCDRSRKINRIVGANDSLYHTLRNMLDK
jgi:tetratricopeptide (TPR) repeat protein